MTNQSTGISMAARSNGEGRYDFVSVAPGCYIVSAAACGFEKANAAVFQITTNARQRVDVALNTGATTETVTVSADATLLQTETSSRGQVIGTREIENLTLNGRSSEGVINASVRRGTNQFHGRAWDYIRNTKLNAIGPFNPMAA